MTHIVYYKRYRMERDLADLPPVPDLPPGFIWMPWSNGLLEPHAEVKHRCFREEIDANIFRSFTTLNGCIELMRTISGQSGFCAAATWLIADAAGFCATIQGLCDRENCGMIQNLGVVPGYRGQGLGRALLLQALHGFRQTGYRRSSLEVTVRNESAVQMYRRYGFRATKSVYRGVEVPVEAPQQHEAGSGI